MPSINLLPKSVAEKIAAGEVVERPASVIKELVENSIDAGATRITVEIERGGITLMRVTDNGCGIKSEDVSTAFLRHATSKITSESDLDSISTLGFRGEALAAISAVSKVEMITSDGTGAGTVYSIEGGEKVSVDEIGCARGTIITVRDIFFNVPARMKFLKKDIAEGNTISAVIDRMALSHPEISFTFIRDSKRVLSTSGDGKLFNVICSVLGRDIASALIPATYSLSGVEVNGFVCKPVNCRPNRNYQFFYINGRLVKSMTASIALDNAYKNSAMVGKYPFCVLNIKTGYDTVDVNVHPAKTEVRFCDDKKIYDCIYFAAKSAISEHDTRPQIVPSHKPIPRPNRMAVEEYRQLVINSTECKENYEKKTDFTKNTNSVYSATHTFNDSKLKAEDVIKRKNPLDVLPEAPDIDKIITPKPIVKSEPEEEPEFIEITDTYKFDDDNAETVTEKKEILPEIRFIGEAFKTYIICEKGKSIFLIDKHAAHERILFEKFKSEKAGSQLLLSPVTVTLQKDEYTAITENISLLRTAGFETEDFGNGAVLVRTVPANLTASDVPSLISEIAGSLLSGGKLKIEKLDDIYHRVSCRSAVKAGNTSSEAELVALAGRILSSDDIMYCPHGRPVAFEISRHSLEKHFGRV